MQLNEIRKTHYKSYLPNRSNKTDNFIQNSDHNKKEITQRLSTTKNRKSQCAHKKLENQIFEGNKSHHQKYQISGVDNNSFITDADNISYTDTDNIASPKKWILHREPKNTVLIVGDSIRMSRMSR